MSTTEQISPVEPTPSATVVLPHGMCRYVSNNYGCDECGKPHCDDCECTEYCKYIEGEYGCNECDGYHCSDCACTDADY